VPRKAQLRTLNNCDWRLLSVCGALIQKSDCLIPSQLLLRKVRLDTKRVVRSGVYVYFVFAPMYIIVSLILIFRFLNRCCMDGVRVHVFVFSCCALHVVVGHLTLSTERGVSVVSCVCVFVVIIF